MHFAEGMDELVRLFEPQAAARGLRFEYQRGGSLPEPVRTDGKRLRQILIKLLGNAVKFTRSGQVSLRGTTPAKWRASKSRIPARA